jgi:hypothetical protein
LRVEIHIRFVCFDAEGGLPGDPACGGEEVLFDVGMRVRLTQNLDKDRGFVNGALGVIEHMLKDDVFVMRSTAGILILVHPVWQNGHAFMPVTYAYATTMRRAQGATLDLVGLLFDRKKPDRGYAYVGTSRGRRRCDIFHVGGVRRTDWLPVGGDARNEQLQLSVMSESDSEERSSDSEGSMSDFSEDEPDHESFGWRHLKDAADLGGPADTEGLF